MENLEKIEELKIIIKEHEKREKIFLFILVFLTSFNTTNLFLY